MNGWSDYSDLPKVQSIQLSDWALWGDNGDDRKTIDVYPFNFKNTLTMKSEIECNSEWIDLPSLTSFTGDGDNFCWIGFVILESSQWAID